MSRPPQFEGKALIPPVEELVARLQEVQGHIDTLDAKLLTPLDAQERAGVLAHLASLTSRKRWYLTRIRGLRPVQALGTEVADTIQTSERV